MLEMVEENLKWGLEWVKLKLSIGVRLKQLCVMSLWLLNIFMDGCMMEMKAKVENVGARLKMNGNGWAVVTCLFADDTCYVQTMKKNFREWWINSKV